MFSNKRNFYLKLTDTLDDEVYYYVGIIADPPYISEGCWVEDDDDKVYYTEEDLEKVLAYMLDQGFDDEFIFEILEENDMGQINSKNINIF